MTLIHDMKYIGRAMDIDSVEPPRDMFTAELTRNIIVTSNTYDISSDECSYLEISFNIDREYVIENAIIYFDIKSNMVEERHIQSVENTSVTEFKNYIKSDIDRCLVDRLL